MERPRGLAGVAFGEAVTMDGQDGHGRQENTHAASAAAQFRSPMTSRTRSLSDSTGTPSRPSPSSRTVETSRGMSKDDSSLDYPPPPVTPRRSELGGLSIQMPPRQFTPPPGTPSGACIRPAPSSPRLDHSHIYASPTNFLPRRSRGLDFSRAATSLHHSTLAEQPSQDLSPAIADRAVHIPPRMGPYGGTEQTSTSLWSMMGNQERINISTSLGSNHAAQSDSSSSSDEDEDMDEDTDEAYVTTPQVSKMGVPIGQGAGGGPFGSPAMGGLASFQHRQRHRKQPKKKLRGPLGLGFNLASAVLSKSPPTGSAAAARARRESISWQANQLHISSGDVDEGAAAEGSSGGDQRSVIRRAVTRRGNLLPKAKAFARIRAALAEEGSPAEAEFLREAEIVKQVRESDVDFEPRHQPVGIDSSAMTTAHSSPNLTGNQEGLEDIPADDPMGDLGAGMSGSFKQQVMRNSKGKQFWDTFSESSGARTPPPAPPFLPRGSSSGMSEDTSMDSPALSSSGLNGHQNGQLPSAAEITRRINNKRRREDDFDPTSFKRRAVSPSISVHNSPIVQSPMQRDAMPWGSRPGSTGGDRGSSGQSESGSLGGTPANPPVGSTGQVSRKGRVGLQGMVDTNDGIMRMSIE
ncbi:hypothetical protein Trco_001943 [Trichoderma cornu-damae]|uniref:Uncharacterized protein n=1 Tax=Trichoderma cornu-damae TaxID=654480 RepID=A0A9P8QTZ3_9HYPO|nr:hypothetical protein Trco_001943 [Trichoderma cornu-damae]